MEGASPYMGAEEAMNSDEDEVQSGDEPETRASKKGRERKKTDGAENAKKKVHFQVIMNFNKL